MRKIHTQRAADFHAINVTPLIDVVMCLIIFFLIVGRLASDSTNLKLPTSTIGRAESAAHTVIVAVAPGGPGGTPIMNWGGVGARVFVDGREVGSERELEEVLRERTSPPGTDPKNPLPVQVRADRDLPYSAVEPVLRAAAKVGVISVRLATERAQ